MDPRAPLCNTTPVRLYQHATPQLSYLCVLLALPLTPGPPSVTSHFERADSRKSVRC